MAAKGRSRGRLLVCLPFLALLATGLLLIAVSPLAWGEGSIIGLDDWAPSAAALLVSTAPLLVGGVYLKSVLNRTSDDFEASKLQVIGSLIVSTAAMFFLIGVAFTLPDEGFYDSQRDRNGEPTLTSSGLVVQAFVGAMVFSAILAASGYIYRQAITPVLHRYDRPEHEPDVMGRIIDDLR